MSAAVTIFTRELRERSRLFAAAATATAEGSAGAPNQTGTQINGRTQRERSQYVSCLSDTPRSGTRYRMEDKGGGHRARRKKITGRRMAQQHTAQRPHK